MAEQSLFRGVVEFMQTLGVYDIILPLLLIFTIVFAILEKTKILGVDKVGDHELSKKNINAIVAIVIALLVVASTQLVAVINRAMADIVLLLLLGVSFLMLVGVFLGDGQFTLKDYPGWMKAFMIIMFIGIVLIFLNALNWLQFVLAIFVVPDLAPILFVLLLVVFIIWVTKDPKPKGEAKSD